VGSLLAQLTTLALATAASPLPIVAVLIMLITKRARPGSLVMMACWILGNVVAISIAIMFANSLHTPRYGMDLTWEGIFALLIGIGLLGAAALARRGRHRGTPDDQTPTWVDSVDNLSPTGGGVLAFLNATTSPKNLALAITAGKLITQTAHTSTQRVEAALYYVSIASLSIVVPVAFYFLGGQKSVETLRKWRDAVTAHAAAAMEITLFVLGLALSAKGLFNLLG
jgi:hypothetical protein